VLLRPVDHALYDATSQLSPSSKRTYTSDAKLFALFLKNHGYHEITWDTMVAYRHYLADRNNYGPATGRRLMSVAKQIVTAQVNAGKADPRCLQNLRPIKAEDDSPHIALTIAQAKAWLGVVDQSTHKGKRDYALLLLLLHTGIRRSEAAA
jgi:site-specific recombinase XerD